jgi:hypothetical protein
MLRSGRPLTRLTPFYSYAKESFPRSPESTRLPNTGIASPQRVFRQPSQRYWKAGRKFSVFSVQFSVLFYRAPDTGRRAPSLAVVLNLQRFCASVAVNRGSVLRFFCRPSSRTKKFPNQIVRQNSGNLLRNPNYLQFISNGNREFGIRIAYPVPEPKRSFGRPTHSRPLYVSLNWPRQFKAHRNDQPRSRQFEQRARFGYCWTVVELVGRAIAQ